MTNPNDRPSQGYLDHLASEENLKADREFLDSIQARMPTEEEVAAWQRQDELEGQEQHERWKLEMGLKVWSDPGNRRKKRKQKSVDGEAVNSWDFVDLGPYLRGEVKPNPPSILPLDNEDVALIYPGKIHWTYGESESGKSWLALIACSTEIRRGHHVVYFDFETDASDIVERLLALGHSQEEIQTYFHYARPEETGWDIEIASDKITLVVFDGVTEALHLHALKSNVDTDIAAFVNGLLRSHIKRGRAVFVIDHVTKDKETRGRNPIDSVHKINATDVGFSVEIRKPFQRGGDGMAVIKVQKDRPGHLRRFVRDDKALAMLRLLSGEDDRVGWSLELAPPAKDKTSPGEKLGMEEAKEQGWIKAAVAALKSIGEPVSKAKVKAAIKGVDGGDRSKAVQAAIDSGKIVAEKVGQAHVCSLKEWEK